MDFLHFFSPSLRTTRERGINIIAAAVYGIRRLRSISFRPEEEEKKNEREQMTETEKKKNGKKASVISKQTANKTRTAQRVYTNNICNVYTTRVRDDDGGDVLYYNIFGNSFRFA